LQPGLLLSTAEDMGPSYTTNRGLFSDHYLATRLPELPEWDQDYGTLRAGLSALLKQKANALPTLNEPQTEEQFIRPVLNALGWSYETQITFRALDREYRPDYALFLTDQQQREARSTVASRQEPCARPYMEKVAALAEAKYWERPLEQRSADDARDRRPDRGRSPHFQIIDYLRDSGVCWGILTNGGTWRLYLNGAETAEILCYEADLAGILRSGDAEDFKRFCLFFRVEAFEPDEQGRCFLDRLREESQQYATQVEDRLKERIFDSVVPAIAEGFLRHLRDEEGVEVGPDDRETLDCIYGATLLLLYRLFFLLFAEARDLIAVGDDAGYRTKSLAHLKEEVFEALRDRVSLGARSTDWWDDLCNLFEIINGGDSGLNVPRYNGGLFAPDGLGDPDLKPAAEFLEANAIADRYLADAVMLLTRHAETEGDYAHLDFIDFRDLGVRHLGSVYEGLLEFKLNVADTHLVKATEKGKPVWKPADDPSTADKKPGDLYLTNDKRERKATGSYYTPDYIVRYIVENTIGPQMDRIEGEYELSQEVGASQDERRPWDEILDEVLKDKPADEARAGRELWGGLRSDGERREFLLNQLEGVQPDHEYDPPTRVLELKVLDPALGSGHFLVGALDYMTTRLAAMLNKYPDSPVLERIHEDRRKIVESLRQQDIEAEEGKLTDENLLRRMVMKRCLYGVDLNPLAVELSKLSLWLHAFTAGAPLSFLDHHVKCGNSLIGSTLEELQRETRQAGGLERIDLSSLKRAVEHMLTVAELSDASFEDVERSREEYWAADARVEGYRAMLDSLTAEHFGIEHASHFIQFGRDIELDNFEESVTKLSQEDQERLSLACHVARERRFFHWEVEFPEVFFERRGQGVQEKPDAGFDAVVGNPPYDVLADKETGQDLALVRRYVRGQQVLSLAATGKLNLYELFFARALHLCAARGSMSFILPMALLADSYASKLRRFWLERFFFRRIEAFPQKDDPHRRVFLEAKLPTAIVVVDANGASQGTVASHSGRVMEDDSPCYTATYESLARIAPDTLSIPLADSQDWHLAVKLIDHPVYLPFREIGQVNQGEINETAMAHLLSAEADGSPVARGGNIQPYHFIPEPKQGATKYLHTEAYLRELSEGSRKRDHETERPGFQRNAALDNYRRLIACMVPEGRFCFDSVNYIAESAYNLRAVLAHLNSALWEWRFRLTSTNNHVNAYEIHALPIRRIFFATSGEERPREMEHLKQLYEEAVKR